MADAKLARLSWWGEWLLALGLVVAASLLAKLFTRNEMGLTSVWLANGLTLGFLLTSSSRRWAGLLAASALGQLASAWFVGDTMRFALATMLFHVLEIFLAARFLHAHISHARDLSRPGNFLRFLGAVAVMPALSGAGMLALLWITGEAQLNLLESWYLSHALGLAITTPVILALRSNELERLFRRGNPLEIVLVTALIIVVTAGVFLQNSFPLQFLIFPPMMLAAMRGGFAGTAFALILVTAITATLTGLGRGPLMMMKDLGVEDFNIYLMLQVLIGVLLLTCFPVAVHMSAWRRSQRVEGELRNTLRLMAEHSSDVIMLTDLTGRRLYVSPSVREVLGWEAEEFQRGTFRDLVHSAHYDGIQRQLDELRVSRSGKATITFPTRRADGRKVWLEARIRYFRDAELLQQTQRGESELGNGPASRNEGFVVTLRNVTRRREAELALEKANRKLASLAMKDSLTGLGNRRHFDQLLGELWQQCGDKGSPMAVILLDVDHFKRFNDQYGHQQGDTCLQQVATALVGSVRDLQDFACRYGGEEFAVVLSHTDVEEATQVAERVRRDVERLDLAHPGSPFGRVTVSVGVAVAVPSGSEGPARLVQAADKALYKSKAEGRNRASLQLLLQGLITRDEDPAAADADRHPPSAV